MATNKGFMNDIIKYIPEDKSVKICKAIRDNIDIRKVISLMGRETFKNKKEYATKFYETSTDNVTLSDIIMGKKDKVNITDLKCKEGDKELGFIHTYILNVSTYLKICRKYFTIYWIDMKNLKI